MTATHGSIPAGAGEPVTVIRMVSLSWVHPRGCGGASSRIRSRQGSWGPSPRVRGSQLRLGDKTLRGGSTPAGAGEPSTRMSARAFSWVHPRGCGGANGAIVMTASQPGPSPRVRGSLRGPQAGLRVQGSIPAGAGEPRVLQRQAVNVGVHPRGCGGAVGCLRACRFESGPSPRVRGSRDGLLEHCLSPRSIPAGAGEPAAYWLASQASKVHPRGCGGASGTITKRSIRDGPSPRVRGSRLGLRGSIPVAGSIPAGAGEPNRAYLPFYSKRVHPRGCGGASSAAEDEYSITGPSPRVRGSRPKRAAPLAS